MDLTPTPARGPTRLLLGLVGVLFLLLIVGLVGLGYLLTSRQATLAPTPTVVVKASPTVIVVPTPTRPPTPVPVLVTQATPTVAIAQATPTVEAPSPTPTQAASGNMPQTGFDSPWLPVAFGLAALLLAARILRLVART